MVFVDIFTPDFFVLKRQAFLIFLVRPKLNILNGYSHESIIPQQERLHKSRNKDSACFVLEYPLASNLINERKKVPYLKTARRMDCFTAFAAMSKSHTR